MHDTWDAVLSYLAAVLSFMTNIDWMSLGAVVLLICRLMVDVPRAYIFIKESFRGDSGKGAK